MNKASKQWQQLKSHEYKRQRKGIYLYTLVWILEEEEKEIGNYLRVAEQDCPMPS